MTIVKCLDANAKSPLWHSNVKNDRDRRRGEMLEDLMLAQNLVVYNKEGQPTTFKNRAGAETNIDVTLTTAKIVPSHTVLACIGWLYK